MQLDRESFLTLSALLFSGCGNATPAATTAPIAPVDLPTAKPVASAAPVSTGAGRGTDPAVLGLVDRADDPRSDPGCSTTEGCANNDTYAAQCRYRGTATPLAAPCDDEKGAKPSCATVKAHKLGWGEGHCDGIVTHFKPKAAERAVKCLDKLSSKDDSCKIYACGDMALLTACPDPGIDAFCKDAVRSCKKAASEFLECKRLASGLNAKGRAAFKQCLTGTDDCGYGVYSCVEGL